MSARRTNRADEQPQVTAAEIKEARQRMSETVEGGRYRQQDGTFVDAWGNPVDDKQKPAADE